MRVRYHFPEAQQCWRKYVDAQLGQITLEERLDKLLAPDDAIGIVSREEREREASALPEAARQFSPDIDYRESGYRDCFEAASEGFGGLPEQFGGSTAQDEEARPDWLPVRKYAKYREKVRPALDLVDYNSAAKAFERSHRLLESSNARGVFQIEIVDRGNRNELPR
jgi:hypothetical protein